MNDLERYYLKFGKEGRKALEALAARLGNNGNYLWMCATRDPTTGNYRRKPGPQLCRRLVEAEPLCFTLHGLRPDIYPAVEEAQQAAA